MHFISTGENNRMQNTLSMNGSLVVGKSRYLPDFNVKLQQTKHINQPSSFRILAQCVNIFSMSITNLHKFSLPTCGVEMIIQARIFDCTCVVQQIDVSVVRHVRE